MSEVVRELRSGSPTDVSVPWNIPVRLDDTARRALADLTSDGMSVSEAVRTAIIETSARHAEQRAGDATDTEAETYEEWVTRQAAAAPPLTEAQAYVLEAAFLEGHLVRWPGETES
ncbi:hypothetical protein [Saccharopolyspora pogona]|uniref:hypothetical protein n=1 Tax=Saccharopolyspora pogona TaxID=333966 RepID=UPI001684E21F|nr:hypothetical protein [Saccharopolyspora pogona]